MQQRPMLLAVIATLVITACGGGDSDGLRMAAPGQLTGATMVWPAESSAIHATPPEFAAAKKAMATGVRRALAPSTNEQFFDWVEQMFPELLTSHQPTLTDGPWSYRAYFQPGLMVGINDGKVYLLGGVFGNQLLFVGQVADFPSSPTLQAQEFLAAFDAKFATAVPATGALLTELNDGCYLDSGVTKPFAIANFDADLVQSAQAHKYRIGSTRTNAQVVADRTMINADGSSRREIDIKYQVNYADGTVEVDARQTIIWGSSMGAIIAGGTLCATPQSSKSWRFYGNRELVDASVRSFNQRSERYSLATGAALSGGVDYSKFVQIRIADPSNFAKYVVVKGLGLPVSGVKLVSPRIQRDDPLFAGKRGNFVDWDDTDTFRFCRVEASGSNVAANAADCVGQGASGNNYGIFNRTAAATDSGFEALGFEAGGTYTVAVYNDDGWKTVNGQATRTPIATYTKTMGSLPYSAVALAGANVTSDLFPRISYAQTPAEVAAIVRSKAAAQVAVNWTPLGTMPDAAKFGWGFIYTYVAGRATTTSSNWPQSRGIVFSYPSTAATGAPSYTIPAAPSALVTPNYSEFVVELTNRNNVRIQSVVSFE